MKNLCVVIVIALLLFLGGMCVWTEAKYDKPIWNYIKDEIQENKDNKQAEDEIVVEDENGTTAVIKF